jgi:hypothetical protein
MSRNVSKGVCKHENTTGIFSYGLESSSMELSGNEIPRFQQLFFFNGLAII